MSSPASPDSSPVLSPSAAPQSAPIPTGENWIDHEFLFHNEHVKIVDHNTVSISGKGIIKKILRPGHGDYPLPKAAVEIHVIGKVQLTGEVFQNSRDPQVQIDYLTNKHENIWGRQLNERQTKQAKDLAEARSNGADKAEIEAMKKNHKKEEDEALENHLKFAREDNRHELFIQATKFQFGTKEVVRGLELAIQTMKVGELAHITCHPEYAYTDLGIEDYIPDNAVIEYEVELLSAEGAPVQIYPGITKKYIKKGLGWTTPSYNTTCDIFIEGSYAVEDEEAQIGPVGPDDPEPTNNSFKTKQFLQRSEHPLQCRIDDVMLPEGLEECLKTMKKGEIALFEISKNILLGNGFEPKRHSSKLPIPPKPSTKDPEYDPEQYSDLVVFYRVELVELHHCKEVWALKLDDRIVESERIKEVANDFFRLGLQSNEAAPDVPTGYTMKGQIGLLARAVRRYDSCLELYEHFAEYEQRQCTYDMISRVIAVQLACYNNLQMIYSKLKLHHKTQEAAAKALDLFMAPVDIYKHAVEGQGDEVLTTSEQDPTVALHTDAPIVVPHGGKIPEGISQADTSAIDALAGTGDEVQVMESKMEAGEVEQREQNEQDQPRDQVSLPSKPSLVSSKAVLVGKTFPKQTNTSNIFKTLYRRAQALLLTDDPDGAEQTLKLCFEIWDHKEPFMAWKAGVEEKIKTISSQGGEAGDVPLYKEQPILMHGIMPLKLVDQKDESKEKLFPVFFDTVGDDIKKEIDKLKVLIDKKQNAVKARSQKNWAKAFQDE